VVVEDTEDPLKTLKQSIARLDADLEIEESEAELAFDETPKGEPAMPAIAVTVLRRERDRPVWSEGSQTVGAIFHGRNWNRKRVVSEKNLKSVVGGDRI